MLARTRFVKTAAVSIVGGMLVASQLAAATPASGGGKKPEAVAPARAAATEKTLSLEEVAALQKNLKSHASLSVDFTQRVYKDLRKKTSLSYGKAYFRKPNAFRWVLDKPNQDEWIFNGNDLWHYQPTRKQVLHYPAGAAKGRELRQIVDMVINFNTLLAEYTLKKAVQRDGEIALTLEPQKGSDIQSADLTLDAKQNFIRQVRLNFRGQNHTTFTFTNPTVANLPEQTFKAPVGVKITNAL